MSEAFPPELSGEPLSSPPPPGGAEPLVPAINSILKIGIGVAIVTCCAAGVLVWSPKFLTSPAKASSFTTDVFVYQDTNANGQRDAGEPPYPGVTVKYHDATATTDALGNAEFSWDYSNLDACIADAPITLTPPDPGYQLMQSEQASLECNVLGSQLNPHIRLTTYGFAPPPAGHPTAELHITHDAAQSFTGAGQQISVPFVFTNTGDVPLSGPVTFDVQPGEAAPVTCDQPLDSFKLDLHASLACTTSFQTTDADTAAGSATVGIKGTFSYRGATYGAKDSATFAYVAPTATATATVAPTATALATATPGPVTVSADQLACRYGPGAAYLYQYGLYKGNEVQLVGRYDTAYGTWVYVKYKDDPRPCWVNPNFLDLNGADISSLPSYYPDKAPLILFNDPKWVPSRFWPPTDVSADRTGNLVGISWTGLIVALGDRESASSPRFLVETWSCINGSIVFTAQGVGASASGADLSSSTFYAQVQDDPGCSEPSHGQVYLAHKDGYVGPVAIPWPGQ